MDIETIYRRALGHTAGTSLNEFKDLPIDVVGRMYGPLLRQRLLPGAYMLSLATAANYPHAPLQFKQQIQRELREILLKGESSLRRLAQHAGEAPKWRNTTSQIREEQVMFRALDALSEVAAGNTMAKQYQVGPSLKALGRYGSLWEELSFTHDVQHEPLKQLGWQTGDDFLLFIDMILDLPKPSIDLPAGHLNSITLLEQTFGQRYRNFQRQCTVDDGGQVWISLTYDN